MNSALGTNERGPLFLAPGLLRLKRAAFFLPKLVVMRVLAAFGGMQVVVAGLKP